MPTKELYVAENMNDLKKKCEFNLGSFAKDVKRLRTVLEKLKSKAYEATNTNNDEEMAYMYLFRALDVWKVIMKSNDYKEDNKFYKELYGRDIEYMFNRFLECATSLEERSVSLSQMCVKSSMEFPYKELFGQTKEMLQSYSVKFMLSQVNAQSQ